MASLSTTLTYKFEFNVQELRLVLKALDGRLTAEEAVEAKALGEDLSRQRAGSVKSLADANEKLLRNIVKAQEESKPGY